MLVSAYLGADFCEDLTLSFASGCLLNDLSVSLSECLFMTDLLKFHASRHSFAFLDLAWSMMSTILQLKLWLNLSE